MAGVLRRFGFLIIHCEKKYLVDPTSWCNSNIKPVKLVNKILTETKNIGFHAACAHYTHNVRCGHHYMLTSNQ